MSNSEAYNNHYRDLDIIAGGRERADRVVPEDDPLWDRVKPKGCTCASYAQALACYERCDDALGPKP